MTTLRHCQFIYDIELSFHILNLINFLYFDFLTVFFLFYFLLPVWESIFSYPHSFPLVKLGVWMGGVLCWVCEIVWLPSTYFFLFTSKAALFHSGTFFRIYSFLLFLLVTLLLEKKKEKLMDIAMFFASPKFCA